MNSNIATFCGVGDNYHSTLRPVVLVELDNQPVAWLEPLEIIRYKGAKLNQARLRIIPQSGLYYENNSTRGGVADGDYPQVNMESVGKLQDISKLLQPNRQITIKLAGSGNINPQRQVWPLFNGVISNVTGGLSGADEYVEIIAQTQLGYCNSNVAVIDSLRMVSDAAGSVCVSAGAVIFNPGGVGNRSAKPYQRYDKHYYIFDNQPSQACRWDYADAIEYLLMEYLAGTETCVAEKCIANIGVMNIAELMPTGVEYVRSLTEGMYPDDINIAGMEPLAAMEYLCEQAGLSYALEHIIIPDNQLKDVLRFYNRMTGRLVRLRHQRAGARLDINRTNLLACRLGDCVVNQGAGDCGWAKLPWLRSDIYPGDKVEGIAGKGPDLQTLKHNCQYLNTIQVKQVDIKLTDNWATEITYTTG